MNITERRKATRSKGKVHIELEEGTGITRDFSSSGIFFETDKSFSPGQTIEFTLMREHIDPGCPICLKSREEVVRVEEKGEKLGVAAAISSSAFEQVADQDKGNQ